MTQIHDIYFLHFLQQWYYAVPLTSAMVLVFLLIGLPGHRLLTKVIAGAVLLWFVVLAVLYGHLREAPWLACLTITALAWAGVRQMSLAAKLSRSQQARWSPRLPSWLADRVVRDYFRADPRGVFWLDLARAVRGRRPKRTRADRRYALQAGFELPEWRAIFWRQFLLRIVEWKILVWHWLPRWWYLPQHGVSLGEVHIDTMMATEIDAAEQRMIELEAGPNFREYRKRVVRNEHSDALGMAGRFGRKRCLLTEALAESRVFAIWPVSGVPLDLRSEAESAEELDRPKRRPRDFVGNATVLEVARLTYDLWRFRWANDRLWAGLGLERSVVTEIDQPADCERPEDQPVDEGHSEDVESEDQSADETGAVDRLQARNEEEPPEFNTILDEFKDIGADTDADKAAEVVPVAVDDSVAFAALKEEWREESNDAAAVDSLTASRWQDLSLASELLEWYLGVTLSGDFVSDVSLLEKLRQREANWLGITWLTMLLCLRDDICSGQQDGAKNGVISRLSNWVNGLAPGNQTARQAKRQFQEMLVDWFALRDGYAQIRERFSQSAPQTPWEWELLGRSNAHIARNMPDSEELRDDMQRDATIAFFRAGVSGIWTERYAGLLLGTSSAEETIHVLDTHPVDFRRSGLNRMLDTHRYQSRVTNEQGEHSTAEPAAIDNFNPPVDVPKTPPPRKHRTHGHQGESASGDIKLVLEVKLGNKVQDFKSSRFPVEIGARKVNTIRHASLQDHHCRLHVKDGLLFLEDLTGGRGVAIDGVRILGTVRLEVGGLFQCGKLKFQVKSL